MPAVSVIIPAHNRESLLPQTLDSVLAQTFQDWECIIVDDHSTDGTFRAAEAYAASDSRFRVAALPNGKRGPSAARNYGLGLAHGEYVTFLDSDDLIAPAKLESQIHSLQSAPQAGFVNCGTAVFLENPNELQPVAYPPENLFLEFLLLGEEKNAFWQSGCPMWRTGALKKIGGWDESLWMGEDLELMLRALASRYHAAHLPEPLYKLRRGTSDRLSSQTREEKENARRRIYLQSWRKIETAGLASNLRRKLCAGNFYRRAYFLIKNGKRYPAIRDFIQDSRFVGESWARTLLGALLLLARSYPLLRPLAPRLNQIYFAFRKEIGAAPAAE